MDALSGDKKCLNCGSEIKGRFCSNCGQSGKVDRISFRDTLSDFFSASFALEGPLMRTIQLMISNPGKLCREFLSGRRKSYYKPVAFFILLTAVYIILRSLLDYNPVDASMRNMDNNEGIDVTLLWKAGSFMFRHINNFLFLLVVGIAFSFKLFFWKTYHLAEYFAIGFYIGGIYILFGTLSMLWNHFTGFSFQSLHLWFLIIYIALCSISLFNSRSLGVMLKSILVAVFSFILYMSLAFGVSLVIVLFN
jgi:hypothetical protein